jgi:hypothetical protein
MGTGKAWFFCSSSVALDATPEQSSPDYEPTGAASVEKVRFLWLQRGARSTLGQISLWEILLVEEIPGKNAQGLVPFLKSAL